MKKKGSCTSIIVSLPVLNNFLSSGECVQCAFLGSFWPHVMHSCIYMAHNTVAP